MKSLNYLTRLLYLFEEYDSIDVLLWSLTSKRELTENLVFQLQPKLSFLIKPHHLSFPSHEFTLAIAWKRSQSKAFA